MVVVDGRFAVTRSSGSLTTQSASLPFNKSTSLSGNQNTGSASTNHTHTFTTGGISANHTHGFDTGGRSATHNHTYTTDNGTGSGTAHNNLQPYIVVNYIIKT
jgi:microcystin-dependent protein